jgi:3-dehydro-L-gulonate 2-dehydrogenase
MTPGDSLNGIVRVPFETMEREFRRILDGHHFNSEKSAAIARVFAENSLEGILTHGINRFPAFIQYVEDGYIMPDAEPLKRHAAGALEQWDGRLGPGPLNALACTDRAIELSKAHGIGCVALANTNHWMRGGTYGWRAAKAGFVFMGWSNTIANMPAWGASDVRLGNNPLVLAVPYGDEAVVLDMAMSQFAYGAIESHRRRNSELRVPGGYDTRGELTTNASEILETGRLLPAGYWKGSGLAILLDLFAALLSGGLPTVGISKHKAESAVSQVFIAIDPSQLDNSEAIAGTVREVIEDFSRSAAVSKVSEVRYPGERVVRLRRENLEQGISVDRSVWEEVKSL